MRKIIAFVAILLLITLTTCACTEAPDTTQSTNAPAPSSNATKPTEAPTTVLTPPVTEKNLVETTTPTEPIMATTAPTEPATEPTELPTEATEPTEPHYCAYTPVETVPATCTEEGYTLYFCDCGKSFKAIQSVIDHEYVEINQQAPTDTEPGYRVLQCSVCGHIYYQPMEGEG